MQLVTSTVIAICLALLVVTPTLAVSTKADVIEDITAAQLENLVEESDYVAVYWCKCRPIICSIVSSLCVVFNRCPTVILVLHYGANQVLLSVELLAASRVSTELWVCLNILNHLSHTQRA